MIGVIAFALALALLILHFAERSVPLSYAAAAFIMAAIIAGSDLREPAGQICTTTTTAAGNSTYPVEVCTTNYTVKFESLASLIASMGFTILTLAIYMLGRLAATAGGSWTV